MLHHDTFYLIDYNIIINDFQTGTVTCS